MNGAAAFLGLLRQNGKDVVSSVRIKVDNGKVSEAEWFLEPPGQGGTAAAQADASRTRLTADPHEAQDMLRISAAGRAACRSSERSSRFYLISMANDYFQSGVDHDASWIPPICGARTRNRTRCAPRLRHADLCHDNFNIYKNITKDLALRRFPLVDEEAGVVLGAAIWVRYPGVTRKDNMVNEYFQVRNGAFTYIWTCNYELPKGAPVSGVGEPSGRYHPLNGPGRRDATSEPLPHLPGPSGDPGPHRGDHLDHPRKTLATLSPLD